ncbi:MAG: hypothetical protein HQL90_04165 [Magnetococcales bacterium]|nr:hypothetical protein [Magnetococcales bacterium]
MATKTFNMISEYVGEELTRLLIDKLGGTRLYFPKTVSPEHRISLAVGVDNAKKLCDVFGGTCIALPMESMESKRKRNSEIIKEFDSGRDLQYLARKYWMTSRQILTILNRGY